MPDDLIFEKTAPRRWYVSIPSMGNLTLGPWPTKWQARACAERLLKLQENPK